MMKRKKCAGYKRLFQRYEALKVELEKEKRHSDNYWKHIVWLKNKWDGDCGAAPCPFCMSERVFLEGSICDSHWFVMCDCGAMGPSADTENKAIALWNKAADLQEE